MAEIRVGGPGDAVDLVADPGEAVLHAGDDALDLRRAFAGILGAVGGLAAFADQIADLTVEAANGLADLVRRLTRGFGKALHLVRDDRETPSGAAGAGGLDRRVQRQEIGLLGDGLDRLRHFCDLRKRRGDRAEPGLDAANGLDQLGDVVDRGLHHGAGLGDFADRGRSRRLHRARRAGDIVIDGDHGLGGRLQMSESLRLGGEAACDFLDIAGDIGEFDPEPADLIGKLIDQTLTWRGVCAWRGRCGRQGLCSRRGLWQHLGDSGFGGNGFQFCGLRDRHRFRPPASKLTSDLLFPNARELVQSL